MARYLIQAPATTFKGKTLGVQFHEGQAILEPLTVPKRLDRGVEDIIDLFRRDFPDYKITPIEGEKLVVMPGTSASIPEAGPVNGKDVPVIVAQHPDKQKVGAK